MSSRLPLDEKQQVGVLNPISMPLQWLTQSLVPGTSQNAVLTIYALSACTGVVPVFYVIYANGVFLGFALLLGVTIITGLVSWMLCQSADYYNAGTCEEIALRAYGPRLAAFTSVVMICTQVGFVVGYIVVLKTLLPTAIEGMLGV